MKPSLAWATVTAMLVGPKYRYRRVETLTSLIHPGVRALAQRPKFAKYSPSNP
jgi:hypothetical protein